MQQTKNHDSSPAATQNNSVAAYSSLKVKPQSQILLATAQVVVYDSMGQPHKCKALLDSASQTNFITVSLVQHLRLNKGRNRLPIQGINEVTAKTSHSVSLRLQSTISAFTAHITCALLPCITGEMPSMHLQHDNWNLPVDVQLADPYFYRPGKVELLLGADLFFDLLLPEKRTRAGDYRTLPNTELGWTLSGKFQTPRLENQVTSPPRSFLVRGDTSLDLQLQRFWELEGLPHKPQVTEAIRCENHFIHNTTRDSDGCYITLLPRRLDHGPLGESYSQAKQWLLQLERRLQGQPEI
jgi:hypothetical protein